VKLVRSGGDALAAEVRRFADTVARAHDVESRVPALIEAWTEDPAALAVSEFVRGFSLDRARLSPLRVFNVARLFRDAAIAIARAHDAGFLHGDLCASNLCVRDETGSMVVLGFVVDGWIRAHPCGDAGEVKRFEHLAPEVLREQPVTGAADVYSLGYCLWFALTDTRPFGEVGDFEYMRRMLESDPPSIATVRADLPQDMVALVDGCLARDPSNRIATMRDVVQRLDRIAAVV
jgi:serine/threonine-protein kinase